MATMGSCAECDQPLPQKGYPEILLVVELLDLRDCLASLDPSATKLGFCDRGVEIASLIHVSAHGGEASQGLGRKAKRWIREANERLDMWQAFQAPTNFPHSDARVRGAA
jgi:hypothetical protein